MTPEEAREIDRLEFEADCRAARERAFAVIAERRGADRANALRWIEKELPKLNFMPSHAPRPEPTANLPTPPTIDAPKPRRTRTPSTQRHDAFDLSLTYQQWAEHLGITLNTFHQRVFRKGSVEEAVAMGGPQPRGNRARDPGVVKNLPAIEGTGGGSLAQDISEIEIFK